MELRWHSEESWKEGNERWICSYFIIYVYKILKEQNFLNEKTNMITVDSGIVS